MEAATLAGPRSDDAVDIASIQPGGGFCVNWETRWGRLRRWWLRSARRGYVERMAKKRQGMCADCPHDIIDARDSKLVRNVCGYWFRDEDDSFRWRGRLGLARAGLVEVVITSLVCASVIAALSVAVVLTEHWAWWLPLALVIVVWFEGIYFFRDPERAIPTDANALLSPSDGVVTHIHQVDDPEFPGTQALRVSIYLSPWDVHLNRIPRNASVVAVRYFPGDFVKARREDCAERNEQLWVDFREPDGRFLRVKQISGAMARRIVCWLKPSDEVATGDRYGMIKYGSRGDVLVPASDAIEMAIKVGDRVKAGETIILRFTDGPTQ